MTKFEAPSFSVAVGDSKAYRDNWERIFGKKKERVNPWEELAKDLLPPRDIQQAPEPTQPVSIKKRKVRKTRDEKTKKKQKAKSKR